MIFVDGENFAIRYGDMLKARGINPPEPGSPNGPWYEPGVALWSQLLNPQTNDYHTPVVRRYFYTSVPGDEPARLRIEQWCKDRGFESPRVFHRDKARGSKQVDITLATEMLTGAHRRQL
jgi:hypothetical protein